MDNKPDHRNTILAIGLSIVVLIVWQFFYISPKIEQERRVAEIEAQRQASESGDPSVSEHAIPQVDGGVGQAESKPDGNFKSIDEALGNTSRITINSDLLSGSINLQGARFDDLKLNAYRETIDADSPLIRLLAPSGAEHAYFAEFGYIKNPEIGEVPGPKAVWNASSKELSGNNSVVLDWTNDKGIRFERTIALDDKYLFTITDKVINSSGQEITVTPYGRISRFGKPKTKGIYVLHEGMIGVFGEEGLQEVHYSDMSEEKEFEYDRVTGGWLGNTDKYWATTMIPGSSYKPRFAYFDKGAEQYQADYLGEAITIAPNGNAEIKQQLYSGAKVADTLDAYEKEQGIQNFELLIDWGWFHFITKPLFHLLNKLHSIIGNFGIAILIATVLIKLLFLPLANLSYASMAKMKKVQPEMMQLRERFADDRMKQQQEVMALYKREKINPAAGCWPMLIQIPVFFALYKVLYVTIEMRQAPFFGWIQDLSAPDPTTIFNLFGLLPFEPTGFLALGIWPVIMGITMFLQMQMNPAPPDPTQAMIFKWMPLVFTFMLGTFPAGLVIYWAWNNTLSILQQGIIMKRHGTKIELLDNLKSIFSRKPKPDDTDKGKDQAK